ncbi:MAG: hypothetical protein ACI9WC_001411 [Arenicella sp.]
MEYTYVSGLVRVSKKLGNVRIIRASKLPLSELSFILIGLGQFGAYELELFRLVPISFCLAIGAMVLLRPSHYSELKSICTELKFILPIYLFAIISSMWAADPITSFRDALYVLITIIPAFIFGLMLKERCTLENIARGIALFVLLCFLQAMYNWYLRGDMMLTSGTSMRSMVGGLVVFSTPLLLGVYLTRRSWIMFLGLSVAIFFLFSIESRSALVLTLPAILLIIYLYKPIFLVPILMICVPLVVIAFSLTDLGAGINERFSSENFSVDVSENVLDELALPVHERVDFERRLTMFTSWESLMSHPILGIGYSGILQLNLERYDVNVSAHGVFPGTAAEIGMVGMCLLVLFIYRVHHRYIRSPHLLQGSESRLFCRFLFVSFVFILLFGLFHQLIETYYFGMIAGFIVGGVRVRAAYYSRNGSSDGGLLQ